MMTNKLNARFTRAKDIYQREGLLTLFKRIFAFLLSAATIRSSTFYIYEQVCEHKNEADFLPKIKNFTCKIVETKEQIDELDNDGYDLSLLDMAQVHQRLEKGAVAVLIFVERELASQGWVAMTEEAKNTFTNYPYKVNFSNGEAYGADVWTNPKYRRKGLLLYCRYKRREYLISKGINKLFVLVLSTNTASVDSQSKVEGRRLYAKARYIRIFRLQLWKERLVEPIKNND